MCILRRIGVGERKGGKGSLQYSMVIDLISSEWLFFTYRKCSRSCASSCILFVWRCPVRFNSPHTLPPPPPSQLVFLVHKFGRGGKISYHHFLFFFATWFFSLTYTRTYVLTFINCSQFLVFFGLLVCTFSVMIGGLFERPF